MLYRCLQALTVPNVQTNPLNWSSLTRDKLFWWLKILMGNLCKDGTRLSVIMETPFVPAMNSSPFRQLRDNFTFKNTLTNTPPKSKHDLEVVQFKIENRSYWKGYSRNTKEFVNVKSLTLYILFTMLLIVQVFLTVVIAKGSSIYKLRKQHLQWQMKCWAETNYKTWLQLGCTVGEKMGDKTNKTQITQLSKQEHRHLQEIKATTEFQLTIIYITTDTFHRKDKAKLCRLVMESGY